MTCARPSVIVVSGVVTSYLRRSPIGVRVVSCREEEREKRRAVLGPSRYGEATGSIMPVAACNQRVFRPERRRGGHGSEQGRQHDVIVRRRFTSSMIRVRRRREEEIGEEEWGRERTPDFGIEDEKPAFMRDEFASEPPSSREVEGSKEDGFRKKEKKLKGDKKFDKGGR
ncbi:hypothetical protein Scep_006170 [Stephania cephalantha]|uniref:Uncharacterized protein n=1 Tax=Stephania cephalantha TaxID=152367 RepID=A0AAP0PJU4_9MAGN